MNARKRGTRRRMFVLGAATVAATLGSGAATALLATVTAQPSMKQPISAAEVADSMVVAHRKAPMLAVTNDNWLDVHVYALRDGEPFSLGVVTGPGQADFKLPSMVTTPGADLQLLVLPIGGTADYVSPQLIVNRGDVVHLDVENSLPLSTVSVLPNGVG